MKRNLTQFIGSVILLLFSGAVFGQSLTNFSPTVVTYRTKITINGTGLTGYTIVKIGNVTATNVVATATQVTATVPDVNVAGETDTNVTISVSNGTTTRTVSGLTYINPASTKAATAKVTRVVTDYNGYWSSAAASTSPASQPDTQHSVLAMQFGGVTYSTGVDDAVLTSKGVSFTAGDFKALPINAITGTSGGGSNYIALATKMDGSATTLVPTAPGVAGLITRDILIDGKKGLGLGSGMTNITNTAVMLFNVNNIVTSRINDAEPDIIVSQTADPSTGSDNSVYDVYAFVDANGNVVGNPVYVVLNSIPAIGTYKLDLFSIQASQPYETATILTTQSASPDTRDIRLVGYKLSDFGITDGNKNQVTGFKIMPSGVSDPAFIAYNGNSLLIPAPQITIHPTSVVACTGAGSTATFSVTATGNNLSYQWKKNGINIAGATAKTYTINNVSAADVATYTVTVSNAAGAVISNPAYLNTIIALQPVDVTACLNTPGPAVEVTAYGLNLTYQWYSNTTASTAGATAVSGATTASYMPPATATRFYYCVITNNGQGCTVQNTNIVKYTVSTTAATGGNATINGLLALPVNPLNTCAGASGVVMKSTGATSGAAYLWEKSADGATGWTTVTGGSGATTTQYTTGTVSEPTYYRLRVTTGSCVVYSNSVKINIDNYPGIVSPNVTICSGTSTTLSTTDYTGSLQWQQSSNGTSWSNISFANSATYTTPNLTATTYYRVGTSVLLGCGSNYSEAIMVTVNPLPTAGTTTGAQAICQGNTANLSVAGATGAIQWEQSANGTDGWVAVSTGTGATTANFTTAVLTTTTWYRAAVTSNYCTAYSATAKVTVNPTPNGGTISANQAVCSGLTATMTVTGTTGTLQWQQSANGLTGWANVTAGTGATTSSYTTPALTSTTYYRAVATSGSCSATSGTVTITVNTANAGTVSASQTICAGNTATVSVTGTAGSLQWQQSANGTNWTNVTGATSASFTPVLIATTYYRVVATSGSCTATSGVTTVTVNNIPTAGTATGSVLICRGESAPLAITGYNGGLQWQKSANGSSNWVSINGATSAAFTATAVTETTYYRVWVTNATCGQASNTVTVTVNNNFIWNGNVSTDWHTAANWSCNSIPTLDDNCIIPQRPNQPVVSQNITAYGKTLDVQAGAVLTVNTMRNITVKDGITVAATGNMIVSNGANLVQINNVANTGNIVVKRNSSKLFRQDYTLWSTPVTGQKLFQFSPQTLADRFYTYRDSARLYMKVPNLGPTSTTTFATGVAYLIRMPNGISTVPGYNAGSASTIVNQQFTGVPNNGTIMVPVVHEWTGQSTGSVDQYGYNGLGNPYPSTINIHSFINTNSANLESGVLYFWRKKNNNNNTSYTAINKTGYAENRAEGGDVGVGFTTGEETSWVINPGQGFIVQVKPGVTHVEFNNAMRRSANNTQFFRQAQPEGQMSRLWINMESESGAFAQALVGYSDFTTNDIDYGYDGKLNSDGTLALYTHAEAVNLVIQAKGEFNLTDVVPLHYRASAAGEYTLKLDRKDGLFADGQTVYLRDNMANSIHDLTTAPYNFTAAQGTSEGRFDLLYVTDGALGNDKPLLTAKNIIIYKKTNLLMIETPGSEIRSVKIYDIRGRLLHEQKNTGTESLGVNLQAQEQMLIVQVTSADGVTASKKVIF